MATLAGTDRVERTLNASEVCRAVNARIVTVSIMIVVKLFGAMQIAFVLIVDSIIYFFSCRYCSCLEGIEM
jgi:hypothetical protein